MEQEVAFDKPEQLEKIQEGLLPGETVFAVFDMKGGGTGFIGITDKRMIIQDSAFLKKEKAIVSVPYDRIHALAASEDTGMLGGRGFFAGSKLILSTSAGAYELEFRGADKANAAHDMILTCIL
ncbi:MAG TPA: PH domain-containing protein [Rubrobacteraceae bacterium]|nr:PH domain-containing protein [Rubrobacteraceae bacterium]